MFQIKNLSEKNLESASKLANAIFKDEPILPGIAFEASLDPEKFKQLNKNEKNKIVSLEYFVAVDNMEKVLGTSGLYSLEDDKKEAYWLGWYCVDPAFRGKGIGGKLLDYAINEARKRSKKYLRLYTSPSDDEKTAQIIYEQRGFRTTEKKFDPGRNFEIIYKELIL